MKTFILICSVLLAGAGIVQAPVAGVMASIGTMFIICWAFYYQTGPLVRAAEDVARIYVNRDAEPGELVAALKRMSILAWRRRKL